MNPPRERVFFTDRDLGRLIADRLRAAGERVERHDDHFSPLTSDTEWLKEIGKRGWIGLTHNKDIRYNTEERDMVMRAGVPLFILIGHTTHPVLAENLVRTLPGIINFLDEHEPPFIARVRRPDSRDFAAGKSGKVNLWLDHAAWLAMKKPK